MALRHFYCVQPRYFQISSDKIDATLDQKCMFLETLVKLYVGTPSQCVVTAPMMVSPGSASTPAHAPCRKFWNLRLFSGFRVLTYPYNGGLCEKKIF